YLLPRQVLRLPVLRRRRPAAAGPLRVGARDAALEPAPVPSAPRVTQLRGLGDEPIRAAVLRDVLPLLHREGLGHPRLGDPGGMGGATDPELLARQGRLRHARPAPDTRHDADRRVSLSAPRPGTDVGGARARGRGAWDSRSSAPPLPRRAPPKPLRPEHRRRYERKRGRA